MRDEGPSVIGWACRAKARRRATAARVPQLQSPVIVTDDQPRSRVVDIEGLGDHARLTGVDSDGGAGAGAPDQNHCSAFVGPAASDEGARSGVHEECADPHVLRQRETLLGAGVEVGEEEFRSCLHDELPTLDRHEDVWIARNLHALQHLARLDVQRDGPVREPERRDRAIACDIHPTDRCCELLGTCDEVAVALQFHQLGRRAHEKDTSRVVDVADQIEVRGGGIGDELRSAVDVPP